MRLTIDEYCQQFKMSKEMIHSKIKAKKLDFIMENGTSYIIITSQLIEEGENITNLINSETVTLRTKKFLHNSKQRTTVATVLALYQRENQQLKEKIIQLEMKIMQHEIKIDKLIDDKEQMLRDEMQKIKDVYSTKDEQLKTILELINTKLIMEPKSVKINDIEIIENDNEFKEINEIGKVELIELKRFIRTLDLKSYQKKIIKKRFFAALDKDVRILQKNEKIYLDFSKYDYSDLLKY